MTCRLLYPVPYDNNTLRNDFSKLDICQIIINNEIPHMGIMVTKEDQYICWLTISEEHAPFAILCGLILKEIIVFKNVDVRNNFLFEIEP